MSRPTAQSPTSTPLPRPYVEAHCPKPDIYSAENLKGFVDSRVRAGGYSSVSEYVRDLVREDQKRQTQENLEALLLEATRSRPGREFIKADWGALRRELAKRLAKRPAK
jgi:antitoxin ParD1/3/4